MLFHLIYKTPSRFHRLLAPDDGDGAGGGKEGAGAEGGGKEGAPEGGGVDDKNKEKLISQEVFNREISKIRASARKETDALMKQFEAIQGRLNLSEKEKEEIAQSLEEVRTAGMTEKQKLEHQLGKLNEQFKTETTKWTQEAGTWKQRFEDQQLQVQVQDAVSANKGVDSEHFLALMRMWGTKVKETVIDEKPTGRYEVRVTFPDTDKEGKPVLLDLTAEEAVKRMGEMKKHQHLFNHGQSEGTGLRTDQYSSGKVGDLPDFSNMTMQQYDVWAKANPHLVGEK